MYQKLQALLPQFMIEPVTIDNLSIYEIVFTAMKNITV